VPLLDDTKKMINADTIAMMKDGVIILNFARDLLVDDDAMEAALASGKVAKYITDFPNAKTAGMKGVIAIPHLGASTQESEDNCAVMAVRQLREYVENGNIINSVNFPMLDAGVCRVASRICILHRNVPNMLSQFTTAVAGINIENMYNKSRGDFAYSVLDVCGKVDEAAIVSKLSALDGVLKVRVLQ
jgi:D-3-phosphoglycerate dehydrogenase